MSLPVRARAPRCGVADEAMRQSWRRTERHLRDAADAMASFPSAASEYLAHNELGLALDELVAAAVAVNASAHAWAALRAAANEMRLTADDPTHGDTVRTIHEHA